MIRTLETIERKIKTAEASVQRAASWLVADFFMAGGSAGAAVETYSHGLPPEATGLLVFSAIGLTGTGLMQAARMHNEGRMAATLEGVLAEQSLSQQQPVA